MSCRLECELTPLQKIECELATLKAEGLIGTNIEITENGTYLPPSGYAYTKVDVDVEGLVPTGTLNITENGTYDVTTYASADVNVRQWDIELKEALEGTMTELTDLPSTVTKIKPYAFYVHSNLPSEYQELESISSTGGSAIQTAIPYNVDPRIELTAKLNGTRSSSQVVLSIEASGNGGTYFGAIPNSSKWGLGANLEFNTSITQKTDISAIPHINANNSATMSVTVNNETKQRAGTSTTNTFYPVTFFGAISTSDTVQYEAIGTIYGHIKAYINGVLAYEYVPVRRLSDNRIGLYNLIGGDFVLQTGRALVGGAEVPRVYEGVLQRADLNVTEIGEYAFSNNELSSLTLRSNQLVVIGDYALDGTPIAKGDGTIYVPSNLLSEYRSAYTDFNFEAI